MKEMTETLYNNSNQRPLGGYVLALKMATEEKLNTQFQSTVAREGES